ncbi:MAG: hypothetical protein OQJ84_02520, partial [Xanthomonadales bacterium]|nr:hypothetical protein [Xanthomonadales bacterium]
MKVRNTRARLCAVLFTSLFTSISFAQVSTVSNRVSLAGDDFIDWQAYSGGLDPTTLPSPANISTDGGMAVTVTQTYATSGIGSVPYPFPTNMPAGGFVYYPGGAPSDFYNYVNPTNFTNFDGVGVCGFGTQVAPYEAGEYVVWIEAFDIDDASMKPGPFEITSDTTLESESAFVGIESTDPIHRVEISVQSTVGGAGYYAAFYAINQVDLKACVSEPEVPVVSCSGFEAPMDNYPVKTKKNRVFPLKMELFDADGFALTDLDLAAAPVVEVMFTSSG